MPRAVFLLLRPEQAGQMVAAERAPGLAGEVDEQGANLLRLEAADLAIAVPDLEAAKKPDPDHAAETPTSHPEARRARSRKRLGADRGS
jgi:hypothetical protein